MSTVPAPSQPQFDARRRDWIERVGRLVDQIEQWSKAENWPTERHQKSVTEQSLGTYSVPELVVRPPGGELIVTPIALNVAGGNGRVDLEAVPTLSRVKLIGGNSGWEIWTDSNVPLRVSFD